MLPCSPISSLFLLLVFLVTNCVDRVDAKKGKPKHGNPNVSTTAFPLPNQGNIPAHDPSIFFSNGSYYLFLAGEHISVHRSSSLGGPWQDWGTVLSRNSLINKPGNSRPWAPTVIEWNSTIYCFYCVSRSSSRDSAIGVATTTDIDEDTHSNTTYWKDHGVLLQTDGGVMSKVYPYNESNAIDPAFIADASSNQPYLVYGSYWTDIWQVPLMPNLLSVKDPHHPDAAQLAFVPQHNTSKARPMEGSFMTYKEPYYYLWFAHGQCCDFHRKGFPPNGQEYVTFPSCFCSNLFFLSFL